MGEGMKVSLPLLLLISVVAILAKIAVAMSTGLFVTPDSVGYERIADTIVEHGPRVLLEPVDLAIPSRADLKIGSWHEFAPPLAFRAIGYPLLIAAAKSLAGSEWVPLLFKSSDHIVHCGLHVDLPYVAEPPIFIRRVVGSGALLWPFADSRS